ncbi:RecQ family ATP-dependent DNA helicase [Actinospongicola halichondriae]|uniref:RecQ family ATP-dependent DNA helicase n=1 Tax=Actinospongicola halichondriae TaxID=3236844 RepID=UPI003D3F938E
MTLTAPPRPSRADVERELGEHVRALAGPDAVPRPEQIAAVSAVVAEGRRTLLVARTGFGKSAVYFSATRMLRDRGWGPTVVVSPLLALMRDQVSSAQKLGLAAETINSSNTDDWDRIEEAVNDDRVDLLLISPERLANAGFRDRVFDLLRSRPMALVCDEAHCISDWGHDFRPDYLRLRRLLDELPPWTPVLATTATANQRVTDDVASQLGADTLVLRTSLDREALHLSVVDLPDDAHRLAWVGEHLDEIPGSGIIYTLTQQQAAETAEWLRNRGHDVEAYTGATEPERRMALEDELRANQRKALVATSALGMGFDKGDLAFCVHLGLPPTPVAYYQQIGRAGRALERAEVIALPRPVEDAAIWRWFEQVSLPAESTCDEVLRQLSPTRPTSVPTLESVVNLGRSRLQTLLKILEVDGAITAVKGGFILTDTDWRYDADKAERLRTLRREESEQMLSFADRPGCRLRFLREALDDTEAADCGRCDRCLGTSPDLTLDADLVDEATRHLRSGDVGIEPRRQWPAKLDEPKGRIKAEDQARWGRALCRVGDGGWGPVIDEVLSGDRLLHTDMIRAVAAVLKRWDWDERPGWICPIPSRRRQGVIDRLCDGLGQLGKLPVHPALVRVGDGGGFQADQANSAHQVANVWGNLAVDPGLLPPAPILDGPVLLVDDECDSRWTLTVANQLLRGAGSGPVLPLVLRCR